MFELRGWWLLCGAVLVGAVALNGVSNDVADAQATVEAPQPVGDARAQRTTKSAVMIVVCVEQNSSRLFQAVANRCDTASHSKLEWPLRGAAPQVCVDTLSREITLSSSGTCRAENAFLARATAKRPFLGCADRDTGVLRWPRTGVCWWQNTSMVLMAAAQTSTTTTTSSSTTTTSTSSTTTTSTTTTSVPSVVAPVLVSVSASDGVQITVAGMRPDTGVYSLQWVPYGQTFNTYQMARATSPSMNVPAGWFACNRTYTFRVFVMQAGWQLADGHQRQNVTPHSTPFDVVMPACPAPVVACADGGACAVGDTGPGGGVVYILSNTSGNTTGLTFEAARNDWNGTAPDGTARWCSVSNASIAGLGTAIGTGSSNSATIATTCASTGALDAAEYVRGKTIGGKTDWFLPSRDEALAMYTQRSVFIGNYAINQLSVDTARYLTSTQGANVLNALGAFLQGSSFPGDSGDFSKNFNFSVRPVRSFTAGT